MTQEATSAAELEDRIRELTLKILEEEIASAQARGVPADMGEAMRRAQAKAAEMAGTEAGTSPERR